MDELYELLHKSQTSLFCLFQKTWIYHWNVVGENFKPLHELFQIQYEELFTAIDEIAERILTLGNQPEHAFSKYMHLSTIPERASGVLDKQAVQDILDSFQIIIQLERQILALAQDSSDEGTSALMSDYIRNQEKTIWMYAAYLGTAQS